MNSNVTNLYRPYYIILCIILFYTIILYYTSYYNLSGSLCIIFSNVLLCITILWLLTADWLLGRRYHTPEPTAKSRQRRAHGPKFYYIPHDRIVEEGDTVTFQCAVKGAVINNITAIYIIYKNIKKFTYAH